MVTRGAALVVVVGDLLAAVVGTVGVDEGSKVVVVVVRLTLTSYLEGSRLNVAGLVRSLQFAKSVLDNAAGTASKNKSFNTNAATGAAKRPPKPDSSSNTLNT